MQPEQPDQPTTNSSEPAAPPATAAPTVIMPDASASAPVVSDTSPVFTSPEPVVAGGTVSTAKPGGKFGGLRSKKAWLIGLGVAVLLGGSASAYYFGYYMKPSTVLSQSLSNSGKGYDKLVNYFDAQSKVNYKGSVISGSYKVTASGTTADGYFNIKSDGDNSDSTLDVGAAGTRVNLEIMTIKSSSKTPDIYLKATGIKGLGALAGSPEIDAETTKLEGQWISIDHTLVDQLKSDAGASTTLSNNVKPPTEDQIMSAAKGFGDVNKQYLFTTNKDKSVTTVLKTYGTETVDGNKTDHYKMGLNKANAKAYLKAQESALESSSLWSWIKTNKYDTQVKDAFTQMEASTDNIKSTDTFDLWANVSTRLIYKVRVNDNTNPASNYVDLGLNYKGGSSYPFFISGQSDGTKFNFTATLDSKTNNVKLAVTANDSSASGVNVSINADAKPSNSAVKVTKPANAIPLMQVLNDLGLGDFLTGLGQLQPQSSATSSANAQAEKCAAEFEAFSNSNGTSAISPDCESAFGQ